MIAAIKSSKGESVSGPGEEDDPFESHRAVTRAMVRFLELLPRLAVSECCRVYAYTFQMFMRVGVPILVHNMDALGAVIQRLTSAPAAISNLLRHELCELLQPLLEHA